MASLDQEAVETRALVDPLEGLLLDAAAGTRAVGAEVPVGGWSVRRLTFSLIPVASATSPPPGPGAAP